MSRWQDGLLIPVVLGLAACVSEARPLRTGLEVLEAGGFAELKGKRVGVITNPTGVNRGLQSLPELLAACPGVSLAAVFAPEHGVQGAVEAGVSVGHAVDPRTGVPVYSLYGAVRRPTPEMLAGLDVVLFDVQDIGVRTYTYLATLKEALVACARERIQLWVLDRPMPVGGEILEGPVLEEGQESFVGPHRLPLRHGLTAGEFARMVNEEAGIGASLRVIAMEGYDRRMPYEASGLVWVAPSPNIPTVETALVYAGMVLVEGTNLSEGRGTARPFHLTGAPWLDGRRLACELNALHLPGCLFRAQGFAPSASKWAGVECGGVEIHVVDRRTFRAVTAAVALLSAVKRLHPEELEIRAQAFDRLAGTPKLRQAIEKGVPIPEIVASWAPELEAYAARRKRFLLY